MKRRKRTVIPPKCMQDISCSENRQSSTKVPNFPKLCWRCITRTRTEKGGRGGSGLQEISNESHTNSIIYIAQNENS